MISFQIHSRDGGFEKKYPSYPFPFQTSLSIGGKEREAGGKCPEVTPIGPYMGCLG
jgi:hypothetical protein